MTSELSTFAARVCAFIAASSSVNDSVREPGTPLNPGTRNSPFKNEPPDVGCYQIQFPTLAQELFGLQFAHNAAYRKYCESRRDTPLTVTHWSQIPAIPTAAFKEFELTSLAPGERTHVFHSSGTTEIGRAHV